MLASLVLLCALVAAGSATAARQPTTAERAAILRALPAALLKVPVTCRRIRISVARNGRFALASPLFAPTRRCLRYASNGFYVLRRGPSRWRVVYNGSVPPPCRLGVPFDLTPCSR
jgi:hypothetical protein